MTVEMPARERYTHLGHGPSIGQILFGLLLVLAGGVWLLHAAGVIDISWDIVLPLALIGVGLSLIASAGSRDHGGLIFLGILLTLIMVVSSIGSIPLSGGVGDRTTTPVAITELKPEYNLFIGSQTIDLRNLDLPAGDTHVKVGVGIGEMIIQVPPEVAIEANVRFAAGEANIRGGEASENYAGVAVERIFTAADYDTAPKRLRLDLSMGLGTIEVRQ